MRIFSIFAFLMMLTACASNPEAEQLRATRQMTYKIQVYGPACEKLGFATNTDGWRECVQREYEQTLMQQQRQWDHPYYWGPYYQRPFYWR